MFALTIPEERLFKSLTTPAKIQEYLNTIPYNFEQSGETCMSPRRVIQEKRAHCLEGAYFAAAVLWYHGEKPLLLDLRSTKDDLDHVVALFQRDGYWGAISKTNHAVLRYREPIYKTIRELALSYFHEYFLDDGTKTMRDYSKPFSLKPFGTAWVTSEIDLWEIGATLDDSIHTPLLPPHLKPRMLRKADTVEIAAGKIIEYTKGSMARTQKGFTLIELLVVIAIIGVLASIVITSLNGARSKAETAKAVIEMKSLRTAMTLLENDVGKWPNGCPIDGVDNPEVDLTAANAGLLLAPVAPFSADGCSWNSTDVANWRGPYAATATDKWGHPYVFDPDYHVCVNGLNTAYPVIVSYGANTEEDYPLDPEVGAVNDSCVSVVTDDIYIKLTQ